MFALFPLGFGIYISLTNWPLIGPYHFIGLANYTALVHNSVYLQSILFTLKYTAIVTVPIFVVGYALAVFVRANRPGSTVFRTMIFMPYIVGLVTLSFMAVVELQPTSGSVNFVLAKFGIVKVTTAWLVHTGLALTAISILVIWLAAGFTMMLLMAGMQAIPQEIYESARVDGASWWSAEWNPHGPAAAPLDRAEPDRLGGLLVPGLQPVLHHDRRRARHQHRVGGDGDLRHRLRGHERRPGQRDVRSARHRGRADHLRPVPLPARRTPTDGRGTQYGAGAAERRAARARARGREARRAAVAWYIAGGVAISAIFVIPLLWEVLRSFQPESAVTNTPSAAGFTHLTWANYTTLLSGQDDILRNVINSLIVGVLSAVITAVVATLAGYGFAMFPFRGSGLAFGVVLVAFMIPFQAVLTPLFLELHFLHLLNSLIGLALFNTTFILPLGAFVMRNSFLQVPQELADAARVDGASVTKSLISVFRPLVMPGIATTALYAFLFSWTEFLGALTFLTNDSLFTLPVALSNAETGTYGAVNYGLLLAGAVIAMIPCVVVYVSLQRFYVRGLVSGALKG